MTGSDLYQQAIVEHARNPRRFGPLAQANRHAEGQNPLCGDELVVHLRVDSDQIAAAGFEGQGCAVCVASASMMAGAVEGRSAASARDLARRVEALAGGSGPENLGGELNALAGVSKYPARVKCALLAWRALVAALDGAGAVSTES